TWQQGSLVSGTFDGFNIYSSSSGIFITTAAPNVFSYVQTGLTPNTTGSIAVAAYTTSGDGPLTFASTYYTFCSTPIVTGGQAPVTFSSVTSNSLLLSYGANGNVPGTIYEITQSTDD